VLLFEQQAGDVSIMDESETLARKHLQAMRPAEAGLPYPSPDGAVDV
jgi:hypothetical protein